MANQIRIKRRASSGLAGAPSSLLNAEIAYNEADNVLYYGYGDNGSGVATSIIAIAGSGSNVTLSGTQTVTGNKTLSGTLNASGTFQINGATVTATSAQINHLVGVTSGVQGQIDDNEAHIDNIVSLSGVSKDEVDLGAFAGSTIADDLTVKSALQALETALEDGSGDLAGDSGTASFVSGSVTIAGGTGLTSTGNNNTLTVSLDNTSVTAAAYGAADAVPSYTVDAQGRLTAAADVSIDIVHTQVSDFDAGVQTNTLDSLAQPVASVAMNSQRITGLSCPVDDFDAATKIYVDHAIEGLDPKESVRAATTASVTLGNTQTIDGVSLVAGDRVLVKNNTTASENGVYKVVSGGSWTRAEDFNSDADISSGAFFFVEEGTVNGNAGFTLTTNETIVLDTTSLEFIQFSGAGQITAGQGLSKAGNTLNVGTADSGRIVVSANDIDLAAHGNAGTYNGLTVDTYGRVSSFVQLTTMAGYGITDGLTASSTIDGGGF